MTYSLCIDIGGTFTDCMVSNANGALQLFNRLLKKSQTIA
jgi:N-methylhydantoinase A